MAGSLMGASASPSAERLASKEPDMQQRKTSFSSKMTRAATAAAGALSLATLAACASQPIDTPPVVSSRPYGPAYPPVAQASYVEYGRVSAVEVIRTEEKRKSSGAGAI